MINRVLIRIKVVQMLYSYLLTQGEFKLAELPENSSRDKKFAHALYVDFLLLTLRLSGFKFSPTMRSIAGVDDNKYLPTNRVARLLNQDSDLKAAAKSADFEALFSNGLIADIHGEITRSAIYRSFIRLKNRQITDDVKFWITIFDTIFAKSDAILAAVRGSELITASGFEMALEMTKASVEEIGRVNEMYINARNSLNRSLDKSFDLYNALLLLPIELTHAEDLRLDAARHKFLATSEDLNPNTRFVDNAMVKVLNNNEELASRLSENPFSWNDDPQLLRSLLEAVTSSDIYAEYMSAESTDLKSDCDFWRTIFKNVILPNDALAEALENMSVYWNDDLDIFGTFVMKTMRRISDSERHGSVLLPKFKDEEDASFGGELFMDTIDHFEEYRGLIDMFIDRRQWDTERLAFMDVVIMTAAISELLNYPAIPIAVTLNEYIEIANSYSSPKSGQFIHGILYSDINHHKSEGRLNKN